MPRKEPPRYQRGRLKPGRKDPTSTFKDYEHKENSEESRTRKDREASEFLFNDEDSDA